MPSKRHMQSYIRINPHARQKFREFYRSGFLTDMTIVVNGEQYFQTHRLVLSIRSRFFQNKLTQPDFASNGNNLYLRESEESSELFGEFVKYLYFEALPLKCDNVLQFLKLGVRYRVSDLVKDCLEFMIERKARGAKKGKIIEWLQYSTSKEFLRISGEKNLNVLFLYEEEHNTLFHSKYTLYYHLRRELLNHIKWNFKEIAESESFMNMGLNILLFILRQDDLVIDSEMLLYSLCIRWLSGKKVKLMQKFGPERTKKLLDVWGKRTISRIRFPMMCPDDLESILSDPDALDRIKYLGKKISVAQEVHKRSYFEDFEDPNICKQLVPRIYTDENTFGSKIVFSKLYEDLYPLLPRKLFILSPTKYALSLPIESPGDHFRWSLEVYTNGVFFSSCLMNNDAGPPIKIPGGRLHRLRFVLRWLHDESEEPLERVFAKVAFAFTGLRNGIRHIADIAYYAREFTPQSDVFMVNKMLPFNEVHPPRNGKRRKAFLQKRYLFYTRSNRPKIKNTPNTKYVFGENDAMTVNVSIMPLFESSHVSKYLSYNSAFIQPRLRRFKIHH